jgi:hypothetical protein
MTRSNSWSGFPAPRFSTARNLSRATYGPRVAEVARALGDPGTWRACMPAIGHTVSEQAVRAELDRLDRLEFRRAYLNQHESL